MATKIEWTRGDDGMPGETWNPTTGCDKISPGCGLPRFDGDDTGGCYAMSMAKRLKGMGQAKYQNDGDPRTSGPGFGLTVHPDALTVPLRWHKPRRVFVNSMSDLGHARVPADFLAQVWAVMAATPQHTYQILTKRPARMQSLLSRGELGTDGFPDMVEEAMAEFTHASLDEWPLPNVWMGTSIELDRYCRRADDLRETPAAVRFLSLEPLLGPLPSLDLTGIDWAIIGGESGPGAREMDIGWARELVSRCREAGTAVFVKQLGSVLGRELGAGPKGGDWDAWPADLRVREFPHATETTRAA
jgi:protein gp37